MPVRRLCDDPHFEHLRKQAKALRRRVLASEPEALALVAEFHPRPSEPFSLADAQLVTARMYGFASWPRLKQHLETVERYRRSPQLVPQAAALPDEFLRLACLTYGADYRERVREAEALRSAAATANVFTMAATGSADALRAALAANPALARAQGGPFQWDPLLYLCYARISAPGRYLAAAELLLAHGADPNTGFLWDGLPSPFTALTGAIGGGEDDQPPHPDGLALARLLLRAGANANDSQALYHQGLAGSWSDDTAHLELLLEFGLGRGDGGPWQAKLGPALQTPAELMRTELATAALRGGPRRAALLLAHGAEVDGIGAHPAFGGRTPYELALLNGHTEVASLLAAAGARARLSDTESFIADCMKADPAVRSASPALLAQVRAEAPDLINRAAEYGNTEVVRLLVELGFDIDHLARTTPLHAAVWNDDLAMVQTLISLGADPSIPDAEHDATALGWAEYAENERMAAYLASLGHR